MKYVVIGASAAGISAVKTLRELNPDAEILLISQDKYTYSRCLLYHYLDDSRTLEELNFAGIDFENGLHIQWLKGVKVIDIDTSLQRVILDTNEHVGYDKLLIATGSHTNMIPIPGLKEAKNIIGFRNLEDAIKIKEKLPHIQNIFVMGAGLVGIDVIAGLLKYQKNITLCDMGEHMLPLQLDAYSAKTYQDLFQENHVKQYYKTSVKEFVLDENKNCYQVVLSDGTIINTDYIINCAGVKSNIEFIKNTPLKYDRFGLIIDDQCQTNIPNIYGAGDVTGKNTVWSTAVREGIIAAYSMSHQFRELNDYLLDKINMYFFDIPTVSLGQINSYDESYQKDITYENNNYRKIISKDNVIVGAILQGDISQSGILSEMIRYKLKDSDNQFIQSGKSKKL